MKKELNKEGIVDARVLANYIIDKANGNISPIKLQKSLYFCFAYWGGFVRKGKNGKSEITQEYPELLFGNRIEAWVYGPVVPDVYHCENLDSYKNASENIFGSDFIKNYIDGILDDVLKANDFTLVDASHRDKCWKNHFIRQKFFHNDKIPHEEIIKEYAANF